MPGILRTQDSNTWAREVLCLCTSDTGLGLLARICQIQSTRHIAQGTRLRSKDWCLPTAIVNYKGDDVAGAYLVDGDGARDVADLDIGEGDAADGSPPAVVRLDAHGVEGVADVEVGEGDVGHAAVDPVLAQAPNAA